jgi:RHS repeat-associated protein
MPWKFQARLDLSGNPTDPLYEFSARFYVPAVGAFSQLDTYAGDVDDPLSLHRYLYAAANPWTLIDPTGHAFICGAEGQCAGRQPPPPINPDRPAPSPLPPSVPKPPAGPVLPPDTSTPNPSPTVPPTPSPTSDPARTSPRIVVELDLAGLVPCDPVLAGYALGNMLVASFELALAIPATASGVMSWADYFLVTLALSQASMASTDLYNAYNCDD